MAFINRSERNILNFDKINSNSVPFYQDNTQNNNSQIYRWPPPKIPFNIKSERKFIYNINQETPGPGYYQIEKNNNKNYYQQSMFLDFIQNSTKNIIEKMFKQEQLKNELKNKNNIEYKINNDLVKNSHNNNKKKIFSCHINKRLNLNNNDIHTNNDYRINSIPSENQKYGYEYDTNGVIKISHNEKNLKNQYSSSNYLNSETETLQTKISTPNLSKKNLIKSALVRNKISQQYYSKKKTSISNSDSNSMMDFSSNNHSYIHKSNKNYKNSLSTKKINYNYLKNNNRNINNIYYLDDNDINKINNSNIESSSKLNLKNNILNKILNKNIFLDSPGPGYYENIDINKVKYSNFNNYEKFGVLAKRFKIDDDTKKSLNTLIPMNERLNLNQNNISFKNFTKENKNRYNINQYYIKKENLKFKKNLIKKKNKDKENNFESPSPNSYSPFKYDNFCKKSYNKNYIKFGINEERFNDIDFNEKLNIPGVGTYDLNPKKIILKKNKPIKLKNNFKIDLTLYEREKKKSPGPDYNIQQYNCFGSKFNKEKNNNNFKIYKSTSELDENVKKKIKLIKQKEKDIENNIGPGSYFTENFDNKNEIKQNFKPFNKGEEKFEKINKNENYYLGPGSYNLERENDWNKKSFNYLYI